MKSFYTTSLAVFVLLLFTAMTCNEVEPEPMNMVPDETMLEAAPGFSLTSDAGTQVALDDFSGMPLVIFFFGNSCPLCISAAPKIEAEIAQAFVGEIGIVGIDTWNGNQSSVMNFRNTTGVSFPLLLQGSSVAADYSTTYDRLVVVDATGKIAFKGATGASADVSKVVSVVQELLK